MKAGSQGRKGIDDVWYSQKAGEPDLAQSDAARQPRIAEAGAVFSNEKGISRIKFDSDRDTYLTLDGSFSSPIPLHDMLFQLVAERGGASDAGILAFQHPGNWGKYRMIINVQNSTTTIRSDNLYSGQAWLPWYSESVWGGNFNGVADGSAFYTNNAQVSGKNIEGQVGSNKLTVGINTKQLDKGFNGYFSEIVVHPGQEEDDEVLDRFDNVNAYFEFAPPDYHRDALLPQRFPYQVTLYNWLETITEADVSLPPGDITFDDSGLSQGEIMEAWVKTEALSATRVLKQQDKNLVLDDGAGGGIEGTAQVRLLHTPGGGEAKAWENEVAFWYQLDAPGLSNPYGGAPNVARRALVITAVDMMMYHDPALGNSGLGRNDQYGKAFASWAYVYYHCKDVLDNDTKEAFKDGLAHYLDIMIRKGAWDVNTNMDMFSVYAAAHVWAATTDAEVRDKAVQAAKKVLLGHHPDATVGGPLHDPKEGTYYPAGYIGENNTPETFYNSESYTQILGGLQRRGRGGRVGVLGRHPHARCQSSEWRSTSPSRAAIISGPAAYCGAHGGTA